jgi:SAM-dependent methyltransferase
MKCPICDNDQIKSPVETQEWMLFHCSNCGFFWKDSRETVYEELPSSSFEVYDYDRTQEAEEIDRILKESGHDVSGNRITEIGCGTGSLLFALQGMGYKVSGFEPSRRAVDIASRKYGLKDVVCGYFSAGLFDAECNGFASRRSGALGGSHAAIDRGATNNE